MLPDLPDKITCFQILPRLPGKSLMRFRCVCKSWSALTCNPLFIETHRNFNGRNHTNLFLTTWDRATKQQQFFSIQIDQEGSPLPGTNHLLKLPTPLTKYPTVYNAHTINGLVCLYFPHTSIPNRSKYDFRVHLFNPCTRESIVLPYSIRISGTFHETNHFGFCPLTNEYHVLQVKKFLNRDMMEDSRTIFGNSIQIFILRMNSWRGIEVDHNDQPFDFHTCQFHRRSVCIHGALHWLHGTQDLIVVFDLKDERFRVIPFPKDYNYHTVYFSPTFGSIVEVGGCLALIDDKESNQSMLRLWILKDYQNQVWVTETIIFPSLWESTFRPVPFGTIHTGELLFQSPALVKLESSNVRVLLYNMKSKSFRTIEIILPEWIFPSSHTKLRLFPSFVDSIVHLSM